VRELRERMVDGVEQRVFPRIEFARTEAESCRERDVPVVEEELRNWVEEPAKEGVQWVTVEGRSWVEYEALAKV